MKRIIIFIIAFLFCIGASAQERRWAVVELSAIYMRLQPDYESPLETQELMGTVVEITGEKSYWREIVSPQPYKAWTTEKGLVEMSEEQIKEYEAAPKVIFKEPYGQLHMEPSTDSQTICDLVGGDVIRAVLKNNNTVVKGKWAQVMLPSGTKGWVLKNTIEPLGKRIDIRMGETSDQLIDEQKTEAIIASALQLLGVPYLWGGMSSKGVDCSGLVRISAIMNNVLLPRNASQMLKCGKPIEVSPYSTIENNNREAALNRVKNLKRGDLVFFGTPATSEKPMRATHVGIYLGDNRMIHASHKVRINSLIPGDADYYENAHKLIAATRL